MRNRPGSIVFGLAVGLVVAAFSYRWITAPEQRVQRALEEDVVFEARTLLAARLRLDTPDIVDAVSPRRSVGKSYVYPADSGWELSGFYRRGPADDWHPWFMRLDGDRKVLLLRVRDDDPGLVRDARRDPTLEVLR